METTCPESPDYVPEEILTHQEMTFQLFNIDMVCVTLLRACQFEIVRCNIYLLIWKHSSYSQGALGCEDDDLDKKLSKKI